MARLFLVVAIALACACAPAADGEASDDAIAAIVSPRSFVVRGRPGDDIRVERDRLVFRRAGHEDILGRAPGDVLVSGEGDGFLRRVRAIGEEGGEIVVSTEPASLEDAIEQGRVQRRVVPDGPLGPKGLWDGALRMVLPATRLPVGTAGALELESGTFDFDPEVDFDVLLERGRVRRAKVAVAGATRASLRVRFDLERPAYVADGPWVRVGEPGVPLASLPPMRAVGWIGAVPVVVVVRVDLMVGYYLQLGGHVTGEIGFDLASSLRAGVELDGGAWRSLGEASFHQAPSARVVTSARTLGGDVTLTALVRVSLYDVAGPYVGLQAYSGVTRETTASEDRWAAEVGLRAIVGVEAGLFGKVVVGYQGTPFDEVLRIPLGNGR